VVFLPSGEKRLSRKKSASTTLLALVPSRTHPPGGGNAAEPAPATDYNLYGRSPIFIIALGITSLW
jgi:hypothetical protein